jgi:zinc transport system substrate-binding protein
MKRSLVYAAIVIALLWPCGCSKPDHEQSQHAVNVAVSVFPIYDIVHSICDDSANVFFVIPSGADPHTFEPLPSIARRLQGISIFIGISREFDGWMERFLPKDAARVYLMEDMGLKGSDANPHIWLSVKQAKKIAATAARHLCRIDPDHRNNYEKKLAAYSVKLDVLDRTIANLFAKKKNRSFIQWHEAWNYFADDYGLTIIGTVQREGSDKASVRSIKEIVDRAHRGRVSAIVISLSAEDRTASVLASEIGGTIVRLDGIGDPESADRTDYLRLMQYNAKTLAEALH